MLPLSTASTYSNVEGFSSSEIGWIGTSNGRRQARIGCGALMREIRRTLRGAQVTEEVTQGTALVDVARSLGPWLSPHLALAQQLLDAAKSRALHEALNSARSSP